MFLNCYTIAKMGDENKSHSASKYGKGNVNNRSGKGIETITPHSKSGPCRRAVRNKDGTVAIWVPA